MKTFKNCAAQGDLLIRRINALPAASEEVEAVEGQYVVAHSETGHNHVIDATPAVNWYSCENPLISYLAVVEATDAAECLLRHLREFDTHETISISPGIYEIRRQREYTPEGWRRVED